MSLVLGIETSCDETGAAIVAEGYRIVAARLASQTDLHARFGGVVPEMASREHLRCISQLTEDVIDAAQKDIDAVAATNGPGLMGSLLVGVNFAKAIAYGRQIPFIPVNHIEGHLFSVFLDNDNPPELPFLALVVSGGHTCLIQCNTPHEYTILGKTRDDAVGESFDKVARLLGLAYPGGPSIERAAEKGDPRAVEFPRGMAGKDNLEFSYSGLKTAVLYELRNRNLNTDGQNLPEQLVADLAASFQFAAVDALLIKTKRAVAQTRAERLVLAGGVAANRLLRDRLVDELAIPVFMPPIALCVDNGAMIAAAGMSRWDNGFIGDLSVTPVPDMSL